MSRFGDNATGPSNLEISNIAGVSNDINTLAPKATAIGNLGPVATEIGNLGTTAVVNDIQALATQPVRDDMDALADIVTELGLLGTTAMAHASTGYIQALATSTVGSTTQLSIDALGQLTTEIAALGNNISLLSQSANNSPIAINNLSDVAISSPSNGQALVYSSGNWVNGSPSVATADIAEFSGASPSAAGEVIHYDGTSAWTVGQLASTELSDSSSLVRTGTGSPSTLTGNYTINGNLTVSCTTTTLNTQDLLVEDKSITLASIATPTEASANGSGIDVKVTNLGALWETDAPRIEYSSGNSGLDQYWNLNRGIIAKGWSDAGSNVYDGQITLNCSANSHGITIKSAPHSQNANYTLVLPGTAPAAGKVLAQNSANNQLEFVDKATPGFAIAMSIVF